MELAKGISVVIDEIIKFTKTDAFGFFMATFVDLLGLTIDTLAQFVGLIGRVLQDLGGGQLSGILQIIATGLAFVNLALMLVIGTVNLFLRGLNALSDMGVDVIDIISTIAIVIAALTIPIWGTIGLFITAAVIIVAAFVQIVRGAGWLYNKLFGNSIFPDMIEDLKKWVSNFLLWFFALGLALRNWATGLASDAVNWGENLIDSFIKGLKNKVSELKTAADDVAQTVKDKLGFGSAPAGQDESFNPKNWGGNATLSLADGLRGNKSEVKIASEELANTTKKPFEEQNFSVGEEMNTSNMSKSEKRRAVSSGEMPSSDSDGKEINVNEKAIFFQKGAFQGVSDEELPGKVRKIIDQSTTEIIKDLEAKGVEIE